MERLPSAVFLYYSTLSGKRPLVFVSFFQYNGDKSEKLFVQEESPMIRFDCDYLEGAHPAILQKLVETNMDQTIGYGEDP